MEQIRTDPDPYEPYRLSQAMRVGDLLFVSGQAAISPEGELVGIGDFDAQAEQTFRNLSGGARGRRIRPRPHRQGDDLPHGDGELPQDRMGRSPLSCLDSAGAAARCAATTRSTSARRR
jgi:hypothetical protein